MKTLLALVLAASTAAADVTIITADNRQIQARELKIVTIANELCVDYDGGNVLKCSDIVEIAINKLAQRSKTSPSDVLVTLSTGDTLNGTLAGGKVSDGFQISTAAFGTVELKFDATSSILLLSNRAFLPKKELEWRKDMDQFIFRGKEGTGDTPPGSILSIDDKNITYWSKPLQRNQTKPIDQLVLARLVLGKNVPPAPLTLYAFITTTDGSSVQGTLKALNAGILEFTDLYGNVRKVPSGLVASLYFKNGRVVYLSDQKPIKEDENANYVTDVSGKPLPSDKVFRWQADQSARGTKLTIKGREFRKGVGVHAYSSLAYALNAAFKTFQVSIGLDDTGKYGDVHFEIWVDGKNVRSDRMHSGDAAIDITDIDVTNAKELRLVVDFGDNAEVGAFADWGSARLIK